MSSPATNSLHNTTDKQSKKCFIRTMAYQEHDYQNKVCYTRQFVSPAKQAYQLTWIHMLFKQINMDEYKTENTLLSEKWKNNHFKISFSPHPRPTQMKNYSLKISKRCCS